jgi:hypothetical protein
MYVLIGLRRVLHIWNHRRLTKYSTLEEIECDCHELENFVYFEFQISTMLVERIFGRFCTYFTVAVSQFNELSHFNEY